MPITQEITHSNWDTALEKETEAGVFIDARRILDPHNLLRETAHERAQERLLGARIDTLYKDPFATSDVLGSARLLRAAEATGLPSNALRDNMQREMQTMLMEAIQADGHEQPTEIDINEDGRAHLDGIMFDDMVLRGLHPAHSDALNEYGEIDYYAELMSQAHFKNPTLRQRYAQVTLSFIPDDEEDDVQKLMDYGFHLGNRSWMIDWKYFTPKGFGWKRTTKRLFMSGSNTQLGNMLLHELGVRGRGQPELSAADIRQTALLVDTTQFGDNAANLACMADQLASGALKRPVFCGKPRDWQPTAEHYARLPQESQAREAALSDYTAVLTDVAYYLAGTDAPFDEQNQQFANAVIYALRDICKDRPEYAEHAFGTHAMALYQSAKTLREAGDTAEANALLHQAHENSKTTLICDLEVATNEQNVLTQEVSPFASLEEKYGSDHVRKGICEACGAKGKVGPCNFCNSCDTKDRLADGYIARKLKRKAMHKKAGRMLTFLFGGLAV